MKTPGPDHPLDFAANPGRVRARFENHTIADTAEAVTLREADLAPVQYFPRGDVETGFLSQTAQVTECPYKGRATYYTMMINGDLQENVAWSYEDPYAAAEAIRGRIAFDAKRVEVYEITDAEQDSRHSDALVKSWPSPGDAKAV